MEMAALHTDIGSIHTFIHSYMRYKVLSEEDQSRDHVDQLELGVNIGPFDTDTITSHRLRGRTKKCLLIVHAIAE